MLEARIKKQLGSGNGHTLTVDVTVRAGSGVTVLPEFTIPMFQETLKVPAPALVTKP